MSDAADVALVIEGGGMRGSYTAAPVVSLIENGVDVGWVGGISAGSSHALNYLSRDAERARISFTDFASSPEFGGWGSFVRGTGYFNAEYIYGRSGDGDLPFDLDTYFAHPAELHIEGTRADTGDTVAWNRADMRTTMDINVRVRASSTLPVMMNMPYIDGDPYVDGAMGTSGGLLIDAAEQAGFDKFLVIMSRPRDYWKPEVTRPKTVRRVLRRWPAVAEAQINRPGKYNRAKRRILELEEQGLAQVFFPDVMPVSTGERRVARLKSAYVSGRQQIEREWPAWETFLAG